MKYIIETKWRFSYKPYSYKSDINGKVRKSKNHPVHTYEGIALKVRYDNKLHKELIDMIIYKRDGAIYPDYIYFYDNYIKNKASIINRNIQNHFAKFNPNHLNDSMKKMIWGIQVRGGIDPVGKPKVKIKKGGKIITRNPSEGIEPVEFEFKDPLSAVEDINNILELYKLKNGTNVDPYRFFRDIFGINLKNLLGDYKSKERQKLDIRTFNRYNIGGTSVVNNIQINTTPRNYSPETTE